MDPAPVVWRNVVQPADVAGEEPATERRVGDESDAELPTRRQDVRLPYASDVSKKLTPRSSARRMVAICSASS
jgi:hypothetical protein